MKYLGKWHPKSTYFSKVRHDIPARMVCTADTPEEQMYCSKYKPSTVDEIEKNCWPAEEFTCVFCDFGCSDICSAA